MNKLVVIALAGVVGVSGSATGTASPAPTPAIPTSNPPLATAAPGIPSDFGLGLMDPSTLPNKPIYAGATQIMPRAGTVMSSPMTSLPMLPRAGSISPMTPMNFQAQFGLQSQAAAAQAQFQAMNGNYNGGFYFNTPSFPSYMPFSNSMTFNGMPFSNGMNINKGVFGVSSPATSSTSYNVYGAPINTDSTPSYNVYGGQFQNSAPVRVGNPTYGTPTITSSNYASVNAALAGVSNVPGIGSPVAGLPPGASNLGPSSLIPGAFISAVTYGAAY
jgi:hypothetical protein